MTPIDQAFTSIFSQFATNLWPQALQVAIALSPIILVAILATVFWELWLDYVRGKNFLSIKYTVLELTLPKETYKSPQAMEVFLTSLHNTSDGSKYNQYWKGETRPWYSLEIASIEGTVKFYMWTEDRRKTNLISALYSQFPGIEVKEVPDYAKTVHFDPGTMRIWAAELEFTKPDPWLIKTYMEFGLDKDPKEELKVDPMLPLLEFLASAGPNTQLWVQILIRAHTKDQRAPGYLFKKEDAWKKEQQKLINEIMIRDPKTKATPEKGEERFASIPRLTKGEQDAVAALERSISKKAFDTGIRLMYITKKDQFSPQYGIGGFLGSFAQFSGEESNGFKPAKKWHPKISEPWTDFQNMRRNRYAKIGLMAYKRRSYFYAPFTSKPMVMNTEELATIYHFPGSVAQTPTLERVPSKKAQAPGNLPI